MNIVEMITILDIRHILFTAHSCKVYVFNYFSLLYIGRLIKFWI